MPVRAGLAPEVLAASEPVVVPPNTAIAIAAGKQRVCNGMSQSNDMYLENETRQSFLDGRARSKHLARSKEQQHQRHGLIDEIKCQLHLPYVTLMSVRGTQEQTTWVAVLDGQRRYSQQMHWHHWHKSV